MMRWLDRHPGALFAGLGTLVSILFLIKLWVSPDFLTDEALYAQIGRNVWNTDALSFRTSAFIVHPPLDFLLTAGWERVTGTTSSPLLDAIRSVRVLSALLCGVTAAVTAAIARDVLVGRSDRVRTVGAVVAALLVATSGFMMAFGRMALIEPLAVAAGTTIVLVAHRMRHRPMAQQIVVLGLLIGTGTLVKQTVLFAAAAPFVAALLQRDRRRIVVGAGSILVGAAVWACFPLWAAINGHGGQFVDQETESVQRLLGLVQTTGVNLPTGSPTTQFTRTFLLYSSGYASFLVGGLALLVVLIRSGLFSRTRRPDDHSALLLGWGVLGYGFLLYSFAFGAGNQQLVVYAVPVAAVLCVALLLGGRPVDDLTGLPARDLLPEQWVRTGPVRGRPLRRLTTVSAVVAGVLLLLGLGTYVGYYVVDSDDGTEQVAAYVQANVAPCVPINASGAGFRWETALPQNTVTNYRNGPRALADGVHLYLLSPKDARYAYGTMSEGFATWIRENGQLLYQTPSRSSELLQLWSVGPVPTAPAPGSSCLPTYPAPSATAPAGEFLGMFLATLGVVGAVGSAFIVRSNRRRVSRVG
ncbi:ArnT family glycosyltransferase [Nakamurella endophytica]|uniref:Glycosyltransferase RgtA/B/C/D-like domain-containing protein n=1 Tax=Nakamurella endophytica TaxID=1748367 RepID=A0A917SQM9_9ACTN|nr:glycosyltransferase family 39 protein [Nakamurella endophytica]GGL91437.1 hypothetical protein GCM10011594_09000 [Nakamurella endophytica]